MVMKQLGSLLFDGIRCQRHDSESFPVFSYCKYGAFDTMKAFAELVDADLTVMPNGEHWFHTDEQNEFRENWLKKHK